LKEISNYLLPKIRITQDIDQIFFKAIENHNLEIVKVFLSNVDIDAKDIYGETALHWAVIIGNKEIVKLLIERGVDINSQDGLFESTALHLAAQNRHLEIVESLLSKGAKIETQNKYGRTALGIAAREGHKDVVELLAASGADILGKQYAIDRKLNYIEFPADWNKYGKRAGFIRNQEIVDNSDFVIAFWDGVSNGTKHSIELAKLDKIPTLIIYF
jgi:ankyrin repeat protein